MKNKIIAGNWKMNNNRAQAIELINQLIPLVKDTNNTVIICVPFTDLCKAVKLTKGTNIHVGAQNCHWKESGAYTGEIAPSMLTEIGVEYVIIGHSERRSYFGETDQTVLLRTKAALAAGLKPIVCIGETLEERNSGNMESVLTRQVVEGFKDISAEELDNIIVAYEPVWAIGTGVTATDEQANDAIGFVRSVFAQKYGQEVANKLYIQYGGSMNDKNAQGLLSMPQIDGGLIGGASLVADKFSKVVNAHK
ncbi:MAG: triose-phosphate isomerase [Clostridia bacterium]|nr:triose-phosphate isomerase [Clostridia bacterium]MBQ8873291.1 triose-phosphate isomerase [Clostridia bacterium]MBQ9707482.1 triose-phosphate isomerase [Clostridia bacterium]MBR7177119.1 triose-phosphate isomerase [Clostridia bacterium]